VSCEAELHLVPENELTAADIVMLHWKAGLIALPRIVTLTAEVEGPFEGIFELTLGEKVNNCDVHPCDRP